MASIDKPSPQEREERIAELRRKRRARVRYLAIRGGLGVAVLAVLAIGLLYWLLTSVAGRDLLLAQIVARLPADATLEWRAAEGPAAGPLTLRDVVFTMPRLRDPDCVPTAEASCATGILRFTAQRVTIDAALRPLLTRTLRLDALIVEGATLDLPPSDEPFELPEWPEVLPEIAPPLTVRADDVRVDDLRVSSAGEPTIHVRRLRGGLAADQGELQLQDIVIQSDRGRFTANGEYMPADNYRTDMVVTAVLPSADRRTPARLGLVARGDLSRMVVAVGGRAPGPVRATLTLSGQEDPRWQLRAQADALDPGLLTGGTEPPATDPIVAQLRASGVGGNARLQGSFTRGELQVDVRPSQVQLEDQVLVVEPLALELLGGTATLRGRADFSNPENRRFKFAVDAQGLTWGGADPGAADAAPVVLADLDANIAGTLEEWVAAGDARLARDGEEAQVAFETRGDTESLTLRELVASMPTGTLNATGRVSWAPSLAWDVDAKLAGFDPGYFLSGWDGAINGRIASEAQTRDDGGLDISVEVPDLGGRLRGRPIDGSAELAIRAPAPGRSFNAYQGEVALSLGGSRILASGNITDTIDVDARLTPLQLSDLLPDASGTVRGTLQLSGARTAPDIVADLTGSALAWGDYRAEDFSAQGQLPWRGSGGDLAIRASGLEAGVPFDTLRIDARGAVESLRLDADARGDIGALSLTGTANRRGSAWEGTLASLRLAPERGPAWALQSPAEYRWDDGDIRLSRACLDSGAGGYLCASADWPRNGVSVEGRALPLSMVEAYLPESENGDSWQLRGDLAIDADLRPVGDAWRGEARITSSGGGLRMSEAARREVFGYEDLVLEATFNPQRLQAELSAALAEGGRIDASVATGWDAYSPLIGQIEVATEQLIWMELLSPDIVDPEGRLEGRIGLSGIRSEPEIDGRAALTGFTAEVPSLGITLRNGDVRLNAMPDGTARIEGSVATTSGEGTGGVLKVDGSLGWRGRDVPLVLNIRGEDVLVSDTRDLRAVASPDVQVRYTAGQPLQVTGTVRVPSATIDLERLDRGVSTSPDVVVLDPIDPEDDGPATALAMDLTLVLGEDVELSGFGLDGELDGRLQVLAQPGREMRARGRLEVSGEYAAYGQELQIERGFLTWSNSPISDPLLDIRAEREVGEVTAGVDVTGRATAPRAQVWSDPASSESEALALLALGRPLSTVSGDERDQISAASAALSAGSGLIASQLGSRIGLDEAGVIQSRALGGNVLGVGKFISPKLFVGYGISLLGTGQVLTLKYLIGRGFDVEIETSTVETRGSVNWRIEK
ncbi:MAG: translocation/assembly module TamB domain-containing protein [Pseudomonadota bacterium]|nr:translocation/assembly module TamB domain-containing protein [Pseudomonadota bacterium]